MKMYIIHEIISDCLCARKHTSNAAPKAAHSGVIGPVMGRRNRARRSYMRLLISNPLIIDSIFIIIHHYIVIGVIIIIS